ncbi:RNA polymerase sigma factor [Angustibacter sp. McL0619]|uniref:RNA polymerase sigma factor n=1 Tax=Angustibacter sp. McL0619 TaxID=3415676 RepID=UPI003CEC8BB1
MDEQGRRSCSCALADGRAGLCTDEGLRAADAAYGRLLRSRARRVVVDADLAQDAVQEAFLRAWRACASFDPAAGSLLSWLSTITRNVAIDMVKARTRRPPVLAAEPSGDPSDRPAGRRGSNHEDLVLLRDQLVHALARLGPEHRQVVAEVVLRDRPQADVAADLGIPVGTVRSRLHHGLRRLREVLEPMPVNACGA